MFFPLASLSDDCREYLRHFRRVVRELQRAYRLTLPANAGRDLRVRVYVRAVRAVFHLSPIQKPNWNAARNRRGCARDSSPTIPAPIARFVSFCRRSCSRDAATAVGSDTRRFITHVPGTFIAFWQRIHSGNLIPEIMAPRESKYELGGYSSYIIPTRTTKDSSFFPHPVNSTEWNGE